MSDSETVSTNRLRQTSMTQENAHAWATMGISLEWQIKRLTEWADMLERRVSQFDPDYRAYPFGRN